MTASNSAGSPEPSRFAPAKINLALHVTGRRSDGYHTLSSLVVFADVGDRLTLVPGVGRKLTVNGPMAEGVPVDGRNLVNRAVNLLRDAQGAVPEFGICLEKNLPHGGGIGGGSADAAAVLHLVSDWHGVPLPDTADVLSLGADVPVCLAGPGPQIMAGIGEILCPVHDLPACWLVLANPGIHVPTADVFSAMHGDYGAPLPEMPKSPCLADFAGWLASQRNDLAEPAEAIAPGIGALRSEMANTDGCLLARMSGSGSTVFGLFGSANAAQAAAARLVGPRRWVRAARMMTI